MGKEVEEIDSLTIPVFFTESISQCGRAMEASALSELFNMH